MTEDIIDEEPVDIPSVLQIGCLLGFHLRPPADVLDEEFSSLMARRTGDRHTQPVGVSNDSRYGPHTSMSNSIDSVR